MKVGKIKKWVVLEIAYIYCCYKFLLIQKIFNIFSKKNLLKKTPKRDAGWLAYLLFYDFTHLANNTTLLLLLLKTQQMFFFSIRMEKKVTKINFSYKKNIFAIFVKKKNFFFKENKNKK